MKLHDKILVVTGWLTIAAAMVMLGLFGYLTQFEDNPPATINHIEFLEDTAVQGKQTRVAVNLCRHTDAPATLRRAWLNDLRFLVPEESPASLGVGCHDIRLSVLVPHDLPAGLYRMEFDFVYHVNVFADRSVIYTTDEITIIEAEGE